MVPINHPPRTAAPIHSRQPGRTGLYWDILGWAGAPPASSGRGLPHPLTSRIGHTLLDRPLVSVPILSHPLLRSARSLVALCFGAPSRLCPPARGSRRCGAGGAAAGSVPSAGGRGTRGPLRPQWVWRVLAPWGPVVGLGGLLPPWAGEIPSPVGLRWGSGTDCLPSKVRDPVGPRPCPPGPGRIPGSIAGVSPPALAAALGDMWPPRGHHHGGDTSEGHRETPRLRGAPHYPANGD